MSGRVYAGLWLVGPTEELAEEEAPSGEDATVGVD